MGGAVEDDEDDDDDVFVPLTPSRNGSLLKYDCVCNEALCLCLAASVGILRDVLTESSENGRAVQTGADDRGRLEREFRSGGSDEQLKKESTADEAAEDGSVRRGVGYTRDGWWFAGSRDAMMEVWM
jgi:hypothetical protein